jgi:hypothetical protein
VGFPVDGVDEGDGADESGDDGESCAGEFDGAELVGAEFAGVFGFEPVLEPGLELEESCAHRPTQHPKTMIKMGVRIASF